MQERGNNKRMLNKYFATAIDIVDNTTYLSYSDLDKLYPRLKNLAIEYASDVSDKRIVLECQYHGDVYIIDYITRFSDQYVKRIKVKLAKIKAICSKFKKALFLTLTIDPNRYNNAKVQYRELSKSWNRLIAYLRKTYGITNYIKTVEFTHSHIPHLHILLLHDEFIDINKVRELWDKHYNMGIMIRLELIQTKYVINENKTYAYYPIDYIAKYITKEYETKEIDNTKVWQWVLRSRAYSISKSLVCLTKTVKTNSNSECYYQLLCTLPYHAIDPHEHYTIDKIMTIYYSYYGERGDV